LHTQGREGGEATENADGEELASGEIKPRIGKREDEANEGGADHVDDKCPTEPGWRCVQRAVW